MIVLRDYAELRAWGGAPVVLTVGFFDGVHRGHQHLLRSLREQAQRLDARSLAVTFSNSPRGFHHPDRHWRYLSLPEEKLALLAETGVDATLMLRYTASVAKQSARLFFKGLDHFAQIAGLSVGYDSSIGSDMLRGREGFGQLAVEYGWDFQFVEPFPATATPVKSSLIREHIAAGELEAARRLLGHAYFVMGRVAAGKGKGGELLHTPTANLYVPQSKLTPPMGIYAGSAETAQGSYPAAICIITHEQALRTVLERDGVPAVEADPNTVVVEAHLIGFSGDLYAQLLTVRFLKWLREFRDFESSAELQQQIRTDIAETESVYQQELAQSTPACSDNIQ